MNAQAKVTEEIQQAIARLLATSPAGHNLRLIGGYRYRLLDQSARASVDIDYHWDGDLVEKQAELVSLFARRLIPEVKRRFAFDGDARAATGPDADSPAVRTISLAFWRIGVAYSRFEIPVEITRILCLDAPTARSANGVVYPTASDADLIESKVIALLNRQAIEHRDFCDLFLFATHFAPNAAERLRTKLGAMGIPAEVVGNRLRRLSANAAYHIRMIGTVIDGQLDESVAGNLRSAGGAKMVFDAVVETVSRKFGLQEDAR